MSLRSGRKLDLVDGRVELVHGAGGRAMARLVDELFVAAFSNRWLDARDDQAVFDVPAGRMVMATDAFVVSPMFFPGGDIGALAVHGTINDVAMAGAVPLHLSAAFVLEEGLALRDLARVVASMARASREAGVPIVTGDTKVVERGKGDGVFVATTGVGVVPAHVVGPSADRARPGDAVLVSGTVGDHGVAVLSQREGLSLETGVTSDSAPLHRLVARMVAVAPDVHVLRDPTRGGLAATLNEIAQRSRVGVLLREDAVPVRPEVAAACELFGLDPWQIANEGKLVAICAADDAERLLAAMRADPLGRDAAIIGRVVDDPDSFVEVETTFGGRRVLEWLVGEPLPRIC